jgi:outer membrane autotransporter protein
LGEDGCVWAKITTGQENLDASSDGAGFRIDRTTYRAGLQGEIARGWYLGGTAAYNDTSSTSDRPGARGNGQAADVGLALKHVRGPLQIGAAVDLGYGWYDDHRYVTVGDLSERVESEPEVLTVAGRLRAAYEVPFERWYLRPFADLDVYYSHVPSYDEKGSDAVALDVRSQSRTSFAFSPMLELGGRYDGPHGLRLRPYAAAGITLPSDDTWTTRARLEGAPEGSGGFSTETKMPSVLGNLDLGLQLYQERGLEVKLELGFQVGEDYHNQSGSARVAYHF